MAEKFVAASGAAEYTVTPFLTEPHGLGNVGLTFVLGVLDAVLPSGYVSDRLMTC